MNTIDALYTVQYNPFKYGKYITAFYSELTGVEKNLLLSPLLIPLFTHPIFKNKGIRSTSSLHTIFSKPKELYDLQERIDSLRELTSESMQYCLVNQWLYIEQDDLSVYSVQDIENIKIARNYAKLFSNHSVYEIYTILGVKP
ncbi:DUF6521 family protein [Actinobacillus equuli subsp. equuli]|uniref:three component ABC system middle component n=1 Tax=Actinobacillus equuli TaxID=718 RepID=UPI002442B72F|nr:three component ABC system middle component [Actinobacillus equuli]WGE66233.1 DUF6521 family protein [Actinobacillus equuli subsp. equuli]WGE70567.1 DUF6521 family protein [Actinobacillus equuli subsp. haemolyticus]